MATKVKNSASTTARQTQSHPEAPTTSEPSGYMSEGEYIVQSGILKGQIRYQKVRGLREKLRGETAKATKQGVWADRQEVQLETERVKLGIDQDNLKGTQAFRVINQQEIVATLAQKSYKVARIQKQNGGVRQALLNEGRQLNVDHLSDLKSTHQAVVTVDAEVTG